MAFTRRTVSLPLLLLLLTSTTLFAQGARVRLEKGADPDAKQDSSSEQDNVSAREDWFRRNREIPGEKSAELLHRAFRQKQQMESAQTLLQSSSLKPSRSASGSFFANPTQVFGGPWISLGPAPIISDPTGIQDYGLVNGRLTSIAVDQGDLTGNTVYIGAAFGGVWKSTDAASPDPTQVHWIQLIDSQATLAVGAIAVQPTVTPESGPGNIVLVGTGEPNSSADSYYGMGILRSADGGNTWSLIQGADCMGPSSTLCIETFVGLGFSSFAFSTTNPNLVVAAVAAANGSLRGAEGAQSIRGIYYSTDAGVTWHKAVMADNIAPASVTSVVFHPKAHVFFAAVRNHGFYSSADGAAWTRLPDANQPGGDQGGLKSGNCPTVLPAMLTCPIYRGQLAVVPDATRNEMYAIFVNSNEVNQGLFRATTDATGMPTWGQIKTTGTCNDGVGPCATNGTDGNRVNDNGIEETDTSGTVPVQHVLIQGVYNLWLGAVPTSANSNTGTNLFVGTRNIYKCVIDPSSGHPSDCSAPFSWNNLTHVYDCKPVAAPSHVHPDQHGFDFAFKNAGILYFANDGGIYRSLNGANGDGSCTPGSSSFDNLNTNLGSTAEFVSFSQHPIDPNTILGGLQDNGSPAISPALPGGSSATWTSVNSGDGGYNEIDPNNGSVWYTENVFVSLQQCTTGPNCTAGTFGIGPSFSQPNIGSPQVSNDKAEFYMPYTLDPAQTSNVVLGTCRIWRGPGVGGNTWTAVNAISPKFDSSIISPSCTTQTLIRSLAVGGPHPAGPSQVIYAGLDRNPTAGQPGGQVWVTFNGDAATPTWTNVTGTINTAMPANPAQHYGISDIWIDKLDPSGRTAYVTVLGFGVLHLYQTVNGGANWTDISAGLPDAPASTVITDPDNSNKLYVGMDVGAFVSTDGGQTWFIMGTSLPSVPVTRLRMFGSNAQPAVNGAKLLRASTYGRGMFSVAVPTTDFSISTSTQSATVAKGASATYTLTISQVGGDFGGVPINLSCSGLPTGATCSFSPAAPALASSPVQVALTIGTRSSQSQTITNLRPAVVYALSFPGMGMACLAYWTRRYRRSYKLLSVLLLLSTFLLVPGCGGGGGASNGNNFTPQPPPISMGTPAGTSTVTVAATSGTLQRTVTVSLTVQ
jgi:hypothetical protein